VRLAFFVTFSCESEAHMATGAVRVDDFFLTEYVTNSCAAVQHDEDNEAHSGMTKTARDFLKKNFSTISRFYSNITTADTADVNGFSRINTLRKALAALDRGGWERLYHQRIFHVRLHQKRGNARCSLRPDTVMCAGVLPELSGSSAVQNQPSWLFRALLSMITREEHVAKHQSGNPVRSSRTACAFTSFPLCICEIKSRA